MSQASAAAPAPAPAPAPVAPAQASLPAAPLTGSSPVAAPTPTVLARMRLGLTIAIVLVGALLAGLLAAEVVRAGRADATPPNSFGSRRSRPTSCAPTPWPPTPS